VDNGTERGTEAGTSISHRRRMNRTDARPPVATLHQQVRRAYRRLSNRPIPESWIAQHRQLAVLHRVDGIVAAVRDESCPQVADETVRAMVALARTDDDASTVLLEALVWPLRSRIGNGSSAEFRDEVLTDLAMVILEADDLDQATHLPARLARRAYARARRRNDLEQLNRYRELQITPTEMQIAVPDDIAEIATDRAHLRATLATIEGHLATGRLSAKAWEDCRDGCLAPAVGLRRTQPDRTRTYRGRRAVEAVLAHAS